MFRISIKVMFFFVGLIVVMESICRHYLAGRCWAGEHCRFLHPPLAAAPTPLPPGATLPPPAPQPARPPVLPPPPPPAVYPAYLQPEEGDNPYLAQAAPEEGDNPAQPKQQAAMNTIQRLPAASRVEASSSAAAPGKDRSRSPRRYLADDEASRIDRARALGEPV